MQERPRGDCAPFYPSSWSLAIAAALARNGITCFKRHRRERREPWPDLISVIVTTYDREDALDAVLRSLARQGDRSSRC